MKTVLKIFIARVIEIFFLLVVLCVIGVVLMQCADQLASRLTFLAADAESIREAIFAALCLAGAALIARGGKTKDAKASDDNKKGAETATTSDIL